MIMGYFDAAARKALRKQARLQEKAGRERRLPPSDFRTADYWEHRYAADGNSGKGSYGEFGEFKADVINEFIHSHEIRSVIDHGCGDGSQASLLHVPIYTGYDISPTAVELARERNSGHPGFTFFPIDAIDIFDGGYELALSLDVVFHLIEDSLFETYMQTLFRSASRYVIVHSTNEDRGSRVDHMRHRVLTDWVERHAPDWQLERVIENPYSKADFYIFSRRAVSAP